MKKTGLGKDPLSWIAPTTKKPAKEESEDILKIGPKFKTFEVRLTTLLRDDQLEFLDKLVREIKKNRSREYRKERITKNTLIRVFIDAFTHSKFDTKNIPDEKELLSRVLKKVKE